MEPHDDRRALSAFAVGVTVVAAFEADGPPGSPTGDAVTLVSHDPPAVSANGAKAFRSTPTLSRASHFAVDVLPKANKGPALPSASDVADCPTHTHGTTGVAASPHSGATARMTRPVRDRADAGDHEILLGWRDADTHAPEPPFVCCRGRLFDAPRAEATG